MPKRLERFNIDVPPQTRRRAKLLKRLLKQSASTMFAKWVDELWKKHEADVRKTA